MLARNRSRFRTELRASLHTVGALSLIALSQTAFMPTAAIAQVPPAPVLSPNSAPTVSPSDRIETTPTNQPNQPLESTTLEDHPPTLGNQPTPLTLAPKT